MAKLTNKMELFCSIFMLAAFAVSGVVAVDNVTSVPGRYNITEKDLIAHLFKNYDPRARPVYDPTKPVNVDVSYYLLAVEELFEKEQMLTTYGWLHLVWTDEFLRWDPAEWGGVDEIVVSTKDIWRPDTVIKNSVNTVYGYLMDQFSVFRVQILPDGTVDFWTSGDLQTSCSIDITYFPFDDQACMIQIDSWTSSTRKMILNNKMIKINLDYYRPNGQWDVIDTEIVREVTVYSVDEFDFIRLFIYLRRKPQYYLSNIVLPSILLSILALLIFVLPADSGEKIGLGITVLLAFSVFQLIIADNMPKTSDFVPLIAKYVICTMVVCGLSLLSSVGVLVVHHSVPGTPVPSYFKKMANIFAKVLCMKSGFKDPSPSIAEVSLQKVVGIDSEKISSEDREWYEHLRKVSDDLGFLRRAREEDDVEAALKQQWIELGRILDRMLLAVFLVMITTASIALFGIYPYRKPPRPIVLDVV